MRIVVKHFLKKTKIFNSIEFFSKRIERTKMLCPLLSVQLSTGSGIIYEKKIELGIIKVSKNLRLTSHNDELARWERTVLFLIDRFKEILFSSFLLLPWSDISFNSDLNRRKFLLKSNLIVWEKLTVNSFLFLFNDIFSPSLRQRQRTTNDRMFIETNRHTSWIFYSLCKQSEEKT